jgi:hypothetical protein
VDYAEDFVESITQENWCKGGTCKVS